MTAKDFLKSVFGAFIGKVDIALKTVAPKWCPEDAVNEYQLEYSTRADTFYALDTFALCPRAYMLKYLAGLSLSIPFYAQVVECVRETIAAYVRKEISKVGLRKYFESLMEDMVQGPFPIHYPDKDWLGDYKRDVGAIFDNFNSWWKDEGWMVVDVSLPVSGTYGNFGFFGSIDMLLEKNRENAIVAYDLGGGISVRKDGSVPDDLEGLVAIERLKRKLYLYGQAYIADGKRNISTLFLYLIKSKNRTSPVVLTYKWNPEEATKVLDWGNKVVKQAADFKARHQWPAAAIYRYGKDGTLNLDKHFCYQRCVHCLSCRWAGWHPEAISEYTDGNNIVQIPQKYIGVELRLKQELDMHQKISDYKGERMR